MKKYETFNLWYKEQDSSKKRIIQRLRKVVETEAPSLIETSKWGNGCWLKGNLPLIFIYVAEDHLQFGFFGGSLLNDSKKVLQGKGKFVRHIRIESSKDIDKKLITSFIRKAVRAQAYK